MVALLKGNSRYYRTLKKKRKVHCKILQMTKKNVQPDDTKSLILTLIILSLIFVILAYFKPG